MSERSVEPLCPYYGTCGGCQLQHLDAAAQAEEKMRWLRETLRGVVAGEAFLPLIRSPQEWHYRRRIQVHVGPRGEVGFYARKSRAVVPIEACAIADDALNRRLPEVRRLAAAALQGPKRPSALSYELTLREDGEVEIVRDGEERSFLQVNAGANRALIRVLAEALEKLRPHRVLELYAGEGNLSYPLLRPEQRWLAVELDARAVERGRAAQAGERGHLEWIQGAAAKTARRLFHAGERFDLVLLDPPRGGAEDCLPVFRRFLPPYILYVSCHALALRKDLKVLQKAGYAVEWLQPIDFFPQTLNLETLVLLRAMPQAVKK